MGAAPSLFNCNNNVNWDFNQELRHTLCPNRYVDSLLKRKDELRRKKDGIRSQVREMKSRHPAVIDHPRVNNWIDSVEKFLEDDDDSKLERRRTRSRGLCCCYNRYKLGKKNEDELKEVERLEKEYNDIIRDGKLVLEVGLSSNVKDALKKEMMMLTAKMSDMESKVRSKLEASNIITPMVRSKGLDWLTKDFHSLDGEVKEALSEESETDHDAEGKMQRLRGKIEMLSNHAKELEEREELVVMVPQSPPIPRREKKKLKLGPWGHNCFSFFDHSGYEGIRSIVLRHGIVVDSMMVEYVKDGIPTWVERVGGEGGSRTEIKLNYPNEYLVKIEGVMGSLSYHPAAIKDVYFYTNYGNKFGPFGTGSEKWPEFTCSMNGAKIVGFHGEANPGGFITRIGAYFESEPT